MSDADKFRAGIPTSTDPARLEREARRIEEKGMTMLEKAARAAAMGYGQKIAVVRSREGGGAMTRAALAGYGKFGDAAERYADDHWQDFVPAVEWALRAIREPDHAILRDVHDNDQLEHPDPQYENARNIWRGVIDSILAGNTEKASSPADTIKGKADG